MLKGIRNSSGESKRISARFLVKDGENDILLPADKISWIEAAAYYCCLHSSGHTYMLRETITDFSDKLDPREFVRIHRSSIVNLDHIREICGRRCGFTTMGTVAPLIPGFLILLLGWTPHVDRHIVRMGAAFPGLYKFLEAQQKDCPSH
ncbi:LytR/AlgR family response regulator transcription factor [Tunturibacter empetritectus]|uniref:LytR/AlgR family response regulator transcription factor n=1 Tax=Tunturiibacter empetritectus TaxID=3069691 RepID=UPI0015CDF553